MIRHLAHLLLDPYLQLISVVILSGIGYYFGYYKAAKYTALFAVGYFFLISISPLPAWLVSKREHQVGSGPLEDFSQFRQDSQTIHIVVLGGGHRIPDEYKPHDRLSEAALKRLMEGYAIYQQLPNSKLLLSGYSSVGIETQAEVLARTALMLGVPATDTLLQPSAANTQQEAKAYADRFDPNTPLVLVTSAIHMPRALFWFKHFGMQPIAAPVHHLVMSPQPAIWLNWRPSTRKIAYTSSLFHEYAGMLHAYWTTH